MRLSSSTGLLDRVFNGLESDGVNPVFPFDLQLSIIKSRAFSTLHSVSSRKRLDAKIFKSIQELDDKLEEWRSSTPLKWRPSISFTLKFSDPNICMYSVMLRLNFYLCKSIIHQASIRCKTWIRESLLVDGVHSSLSICIQASRSTLYYLEAAEHVLGDNVLFYMFLIPKKATNVLFAYHIGL